MTLIIPTDRQLVLLNTCLKIALVDDETLSVRLYNNNNIPMLTDTVDDYSEADFTGYERKTLLRSGWGDAALNSNGVAQSTYSSTLDWLAGEIGDDLYGYFVVGSTSGKLLWVEAFSEVRHMQNGSTLVITPRFTMRSDY